MNVKNITNNTVPNIKYLLLNPQNNQIKKAIKIHKKINI